VAKTKRQLREDPFLEFCKHVTEAVRPYTNIGLAAVVVVVVLIGIWVAFMARKEDRERKALDSLAAVQTAQQALALPDAYLKTAAGPMIQFTRAQKLLQELAGKDRRRVIPVYERLLTLKTSDYFKAAAYMALGKLHVELGEYDAAVAAFLAAADLPLTYPRAEAIWYAGWCYEKLHRTADALAAYRRVRDSPDMQSRFWVDEADFRISQLQSEQAGD